MPDVEPFDQFLTRTASATPGPYLEALRSSPAAAQLDDSALAAEFERMKAHILKLYHGVKPVRSFTDPGGRVVDCVPFEMQPSVQAAHKFGFAVRTHNPPPPNLGTAPSQPAAPVASEPPPCPPGNVPLRRVTLDDLVRAGTLENYNRKSHPGGQEG